MESNPPAGRSADLGGLPTAEEARVVLSELDQDRAELAHRATAPWWYHVILGGIVALVIAAQAFPGGTGSPLIVLGIVTLVILTTTYSQRRSRSLRRPAGSRSKWLVVAISTVLVLTLVSVGVMKLAGLPHWWALGPALLAGLVTGAWGRLYDVAQRRAIAGNGHGSS